MQVVEAYQQAHMDQDRNEEDGDSSNDRPAWSAVLEECSRLEDVYRGPDFVEHGTFVIQQLMKMEHGIVESAAGMQRWPHLETFIKLWRQHFLDHVKPSFLSERWTVDGEIYNH